MSLPLKITDVRSAVIGHAPMTCPIIRIDTNQEGLYGLGEVRDGASKTFALMLKSRLVGEDPRCVDKLFRKIKQFGHHARQAGGVCAIEMALWDIAGKYWNVPVYQLLGGKFRDRIRIYADTDVDDDPTHTAHRLQHRIESGFTFLKMDFLRANIKKGVMEWVTGPFPLPHGKTVREVNLTPHMFNGIEVSDRDIHLLADYVKEIRRAIGNEIPLALDHVGHISPKSCIRLSRALEPYHLAWIEDLVPWHETEIWKRITEAVNTPTCTGEDIYLKEGFVDLLEQRAIDIIHPDLASSGGILETKKIGDMAQEFGIPMAMHFAGTPVSCMANVHCAAATENFLVLENHSVDIPWWDDLVQGIEKPIVNRGYIKVPDAPGLGVTLNDDVVRAHLAEPGYFEPTPQWDSEKSWDRLWS